MIRWFDRHRRYRDELSAYLDEELDVAAAEKLELHLVGCEACRLELEELRAAVAALQGLPEIEAPRSFALSPERAARPARPPAAATPLAFGLRLAAAGVAAALAVVVAIDLGGVGEESAPETAIQRQTHADSEQPADRGAAEGVTPAAGEGELYGAASGETTDDGVDLSQDGDMQSPEEPEPPAAEEPPPAAEDGGGGALTIAEIALGVALGVLVAGAAGLTLAGKRR